MLPAFQRRRVDPGWGLIHFYSTPACTRLPTRCRMLVANSASVTPAPAPRETTAVGWLKSLAHASRKVSSSSRIAASASACAIWACEIHARAALRSCTASRAACSARASEAFTEPSAASVARSCALSNSRSRACSMAQADEACCSSSSFRTRRCATDNFFRRASSCFVCSSSSAPARRVWSRSKPPSCSIYPLDLRSSASISPTDPLPTSSRRSSVQSVAPFTFARAACSSASREADAASSACSASKRSVRARRDRKSSSAHTCLACAAAAVR
eukprot:scaffold6337_cov112-Isochrysis_galbana.AAC.3